MKVYILFEIEEGPGCSTLLKIFSDQDEAEKLRDEFNNHPSKLIRGMYYVVNEFGIDEDTEWLVQLRETIAWRKSNLPVDTS